jgi:ankyrin repeat protein
MGDLTVAVELLKAGASAKTALPDGSTALSIVKSTGHTEIVALLDSRLEKA